ncbi:hypothetical protein CDL12_10516 [Handroanthus impetiginosus]|uniref:GATA-type domain-containing protein n=1 Tax=Handroanthus impetiginosus TaxID=429701 RepID=A0A2G9HH17_9LAMI|nr:hypothetical protein CDL12_10516 [Handroanthus impetiginosus]
MDLNSTPSPISDDHHDHHHYLYPNINSSSVSCFIFFNSSTQDHTGLYDHHQLYPPQHQSDDNYAYHGGSTHEIKNKVESGIKLTLWKKDDSHKKESTPPPPPPPPPPHEKGNNPTKWMSSKVRLMQKMKNPDRAPPDKTDDNQTLQTSSSSMETDLSSNSSSYNNNSPIRVCADCNTTKTPLWRSGPKGPKSLCNACGIRQRKARRAMAAVAAAANGRTDQPVPAVKIKVQLKEKNMKNGLKKRCKTPISASTSSGGSSSYGQKKIGFEDFFINLSKNLSFHRVFPEDEKDAAILLMALSSGLIHG